MKGRRDYIVMGFVVLIVLVVAMMLSNSLRRTSHIALPETPPPERGTEGSAGSDAPVVVGITPETVQTAIATLTRPTQYSRLVTVEQFWSGGSGSYEITTSVNGAWTRLDRTFPGGRVRHTLTDGQTTHIWYNSGGSIYTGPAGSISADDEQFIPAYEEILDLPVEEIAEADYRTLSQVDCIYLETVEDPAGYVQRYWVCIETGLLSAAERLLNGETVYRMSALSVDLSPQSAERFTLPNGVVVA